MSSAFKYGIMGGFTGGDKRATGKKLQGNAAGENQQAGPGGGNIIPKGYKLGQIQQYTPEQMELFKRSFQHVGPESYLSKLAAGDEDIFNQIEAPAYRQFQGIQGDIASRFSFGGGGQGAMSARGGSGFKNAISSAGTDFAERLASQRQGLMRQAVQDMQGITSELLNQRPYEQSLIQRKQPFWKDLTLAGVQAAGQVGAAYAGKPPGV